MACRTNRCGCGTCGSSPCSCGPCGSGGCGGGNSSNYTEGSCGVKHVIESYFVDGGRYRQVKYANGCCDRIARGWIPQTYPGVTLNGPQPLGRCGTGGNLNNSASECMDCMNGMFNSSGPR